MPARGSCGCPGSRREGEMIHFSEYSAEFRAGLETARRDAGPLSMRQISRKIEREFHSSVTPATISRMLSGKNVPRWETVRYFLLACSVSEVETETEWRTKWQRLHDLSLREPVSTPSGPCPVCESMPPERHVDLHVELDERDRLQRELDQAVQELRIVLQRVEVLETVVAKASRGRRTRWGRALKVISG